MSYFYLVSFIGALFLTLTTAGVLLWRTLRGIHTLDEKIIAAQKKLYEFDKGHLAAKEGLDKPGRRWLEVDGSLPRDDEAHDPPPSRPRSPWRGGSAAGLSPYRDASDPEEVPRRVFGPLVWGVDVERFLRIARETQLVGWGSELRWFGFAFRRWAIGVFVLVRIRGSARRAEQKDSR